METTSYDGAACALCGDDATDTSVISGSHVPTCDGCYHDQTDVCLCCGGQFWMTEMARAGDGFECASCALTSGHVADCVLEVLKRDEQRDDFRDDVNRVRR